MIYRARREINIFFLAFQSSESLLAACYLNLEIYVLRYLSFISNFFFESYFMAFSSLSSLLLWRADNSRRDVLMRLYWSMFFGLLLRMVEWELSSKSIKIVKIFEFFFWPKVNACKQYAKKYECVLQWIWLVC